MAKLATIVLCCLTVFASPQIDWPQPNDETLLRARQLRLHIDKMLVNHNERFVPHWVEYDALVNTWANLTDLNARQLAVGGGGPYDIELARIAPALRYASEALLKDWDNIGDDLERIKDASERLPPN